MSLPLAFPYPPMEAKSAEALPDGSSWLYEPKWDGFRCLAFKDQDAVRIQSKAGKPLGRYFPDIVEALQRLKAKQFVLDGEIVIPVDGRDLDGVIAKRLDLPYRSGERDGMQKVKRQRTADCVVGGFRYASKGGGVGSLLLGLYDDQGLLHHVGFTSSLRADERKGLTERLERLIEPPGFTGKAPGGPSRWSTERTGEWKPLAPKLVVEVGFDHVSGGRFRHGTRFLRWRPDKAPAQCTTKQLR